MRHFLAVLVLLASPFAHAATVNLPAETGSPVNEDDWSIPLHRCIRSTWFGVGVYDGAERCAMAFAIPLDAGRRVLSVRALYEDDDFNSEFEMQFLVRDAMAGGNALVLLGKDNDPALTVLETMTLEPKHVLAKHDAAFVLVEVRGDTRLLSVSYEYE
jgi:hypothetical protein